MNLSLEQIILQAIDVFLEKNETQVDKIIADMFKAAILRKYQESFNQEVAQEIVHAENVDKTIDYCFAEVCVVARTKLKNMSEQAKDAEINNAKLLLPEIKQYARKVLEGKGVKILD